MARYKAKTFTEAGTIINEIIGKKNYEFLYNAWNDLVKLNPVDTGTSRYSWYISRGAPSTYKPQYVNVKNYYPMPTPPAQMRGALSPKLDNWYIGNNQDYISTLNEGNSANPYNGWIDSTINKWVTLANSGAF